MLHTLLKLYQIQHTLGAYIKCVKHNILYTVQYTVYDQKTHGENVLGQTVDAAGQVLGHHSSLHGLDADPLQSLTEPTGQRSHRGHPELWGSSLAPSVYVLPLHLFPPVQ